MKYDISVIIVSYNVKYFLAQCIASILADKTELSVEIIIVDNNSSDQTDLLIKQQYPEVTFLKKSKNVGFAKANNFGVSQANGKHLLILNPDTIIEPGTLSKCYQLLSQDSKLGMIGLKMVNGAGSYLPESKRSIPTLLSSFFKFSGLHFVFPTSRLVSAYYLGHLSSDSDHSVEVITGAFMYLRKTLYETLNGFDENFFMYGEDIDLSYRTVKLGYEIRYLSDPLLIHYKGQSTNKFSIDYLHRFYNAMAIFYKKHKKINSRWINSIIYLSIMLGAVLGGIRQTLTTLFFPLMEFVTYSAIAWGISKAWAGFYFMDTNYYQNSPLVVNILVSSAIWVGVLWLFKSYVRRYNLMDFTKAFIIGSVITLLIYSLLSQDFRTSRSILLMSTLASFMFGFMARYVLNLIELRTRNTNKKHQSKTLELFFEAAPNLDQPESFLKDDQPYRSILVRNPKLKEEDAFLDFIKKIILLERVSRLILNSSDFENEQLKYFLSRLPKLKDVGLRKGDNILWMSAMVQNTKQYGI